SDATGRPEDLDDAGGGRADRGVAQDAPARRQRGCFGADDRGYRIDAGEQVEQSARRQRRVELPDDLGALDLMAKARLAGREEGDGDADPDDRDTDGATEQEDAGRDHH